MSGGRPKGAKNKLGLTLEQRVKLLTKLALDKTLKPTDRISAISQITALLNDKIKDSYDGATETILKFEDTKKTEEKIEKQPEIIPVIVVPKADINKEVSIGNMAQDVKIEQVTNGFSIPLIIQNE